MSCLRTLAAVILSFSALIAMSGPSAALWCVPHPSADPEAVLSGEDELVGEGTFWERYGRVVIGTVISVDTDEASGSATYGHTAITLETPAVFGSSKPTTDTFVVGAGDPGWLTGNFYDVGETYFIPIVLTGPDGLTKLLLRL